MDLRSWLLDAHTDLVTKLTGAVVRQVPTDRWTEQVDGGGSSITWLLVHLARHHDLALTTVVRDHDPIFVEHRTALGLDGTASGAGLTEREDHELSRLVDPDALVTYLDAVFDASRHWLEHLSMMALDITPDVAHRLEHRAHLPTDELDWLYGMWAGRTVAWFVQWPIIGHGNAHLGEAISVRNRMGLSPF
ncbi:MAG: DinB family protein [Ilumatobacteraceae bacterium]